MWKHGLIGACTLIAFAVSGAAAEQAKAAKSDTQISQQITMHHQMGIEMAQLCRSKAAHDELKAFCSKASSEMQSDTQKLSAISGANAKASETEKTGSSGSSATATKMDMSGKSPEMKAMHDQHQKSMQTLQRASGNEFDRQFVADMARHHQDGMKEFEECQAQASSSDLKALCGKMAASQQEETKQLRQWQTAWGGQSGR